MPSGDKSEEKQATDVAPRPANEATDGAPWGLHWRASTGFITMVVGLGISVDLIVYSILIPVLPFRLEQQGYSGVSALVGYLLFAYSGGLVISTPPIAWASERYKSRQVPLIVGLLALVGSQIMLMEAPTYWVMVLARALQGISSSMVWVVALALLCDTTPEKYLGRQLGLAMTGLSIGLLIGPPVGGALYSRFGFRGPCIFGVIVTMVDLLGRLLLIERKDALRYGFDPALVLENADTESNHIGEDNAGELHFEGEQNPVSLSPLAVIVKLAKSPRAVTALYTTFTWGFIYAGQEPAITLYLQDVYGLTSTSVGLVFIASVVPTLFSSPLAGWWADRNGAEWVTLFCMTASLPWWCLIIVQAGLPFFIACFALESFFTAAIVAPLTSELAAVARGIPGMGYAHVYGAFNLVYGLGSAIGPIAGGQMYEHIRRGWMAINILAVALLVITTIMSFNCTGEIPLRDRLMLKIRSEGTITLNPEAQRNSVSQAHDAERSSVRSN